MMYNAREQIRTERTLLSTFSLVFNYFEIDVIKK